MNTIRNLIFNIIVGIIISWVSGSVLLYSAQSNQYYRDFWYPTYHIQPLNYCTQDNLCCGKKVADRYCQILGYEKSVKIIKANNVGISNYLELKYTGKKARCIGWKCHGFELIRCEKLQNHHIKVANKTYYQDYYYREKRFNLPRMAHFRVAWCYTKNNHCGKYVANSFCRRLGYLKSSDLKKDPNVLASIKIGDKALCFGKDCSGFEYITCFR